MITVLATLLAIVVALYAAGWLLYRLAMKMKNA